MVRKWFFSLGFFASLRLCVSFFFLVLSATLLDAAEPTIRTINIRGLQIDGKTTLTVEGDDLGTAPRLLLPFAAKQERKAGSTDKLATFEVTLTDDVTPGYHHLRIVTDGGVSLPVVIGVDRMPQLPLAAATEAVPVALHGVAAGSSAVETRFTGKAGQKVLVEVEAQRLGSRLRPVVHLYNAKRVQIAWAWTTPTLGGDARLEATLSEDGPYIISVHDAEYAPPAPSFFRLKIGQWSSADQVFPPVIGVGDNQEVELLGPAAPARVKVSAAPRTTTQLLTLPKESLWSGPRPFVAVSSHPEILEQSSAAKGQDLPTGPVGVSGRLANPFEEDLYRIPVQPNSRVRLEVFAERLGSPVDVALVIRNAAGAVAARAEDSPGTLDPILEYTVPDKVTTLVVGIVDAQGRGGPRATYRLTIDPQSSGAESKNFRLFTTAQRVTLPTSGMSIMPVLVERRGYQGSITLTAEGLPTGATLSGATIPAGADGALVTVRGGDTIGEAVITTWRGRAENDQERIVTFKGHPLERLQPWLATELALAPTNAKAAEFQADWRGLPEDAGLVPASKLALPVKLTRPTSTSVVRFTLLTSQVPVLVNNQPDPNSTLRPERPVELAANVTEGELSLLVPPVLNSTMVDVAIQAELLTPDKRTVLAVAYTPVRRLTVKHSLIVQLDGPDRINAKSGATVTLKGKVERREGLAGDVTVTLTGLPAGSRADNAVVKAGTTDFAVNVVLAANVTAGELRGLKLTASAVADPKQPNVRVRSRDVEVTLVVQ